MNSFLRIKGFVVVVVVGLLISFVSCRLINADQGL